MSVNVCCKLEEFCICYDLTPAFIRRAPFIIQIQNILNFPYQCVFCTNYCYNVFLCSAVTVIPMFSVFYLYVFLVVA